MPQDGIALPLVLVPNPYGALLLRQERNPLGKLREADARGRGHPQHLQGGDQPVARGRVLADDDVATLLATETRAGYLHALEDVLVADGGAHDRPAGLLDDLLQAAVREDGDDQRAHARIARGGAVSRQAIERQDAEDPVAVDHVTRAVHRNEPVRVAVEREAEVRAHLRDLRREAGGIGGSAMEVDVQPVGMVVDDLDPRSRGAEDARRDAGGRAVRARSEE